MNKIEPRDNYYQKWFIESNNQEDVLSNEIKDKIISYINIKDLPKLSLVSSSIKASVDFNFFHRARKCGYQGDDLIQAKDYLKYVLLFIHLYKDEIISLDLVSYNDEEHIDYETTYFNLKFTKNKEVETFRSKRDLELFSSGNSNEIKKVKTLLNYVIINPNLQDDQGATALHKAVNKGNKEIVVELLNQGADPTIQTNGLIDSLFLAVLKNNKEIVNEILERKKSNLNIQNRRHQDAPLHIAVEKENKEIIISLLKNNANPNIQNKNKETPLHLAAKKGNKEIVQELLQHKADPNIKNIHGKTPFEIVINTNDQKTIAIMLQHMCLEKS